MRRWKPLAVAGVVVASVAVLVTSSLAATSTNHSKKSVTLVWWHNANQGPGLKLWNDVAKEYNAAHPDVTIKPVPFETNVLQQTKIPIALASNNPPDVFQEWGGGALVDEVKAKKVANITKYVKPWIKTIGGSAAGWQVNGQQYAVPYSVGVVGFWYNKTLFKQAGITSTPTTWPQFMADVKKLQTANITPLSVGGKDRWPDAFYWDYLAVRLCSKSTLQQASVDYKFTDSCWTQAGVKVKQLLDASPFQTGFLATPAQQGAGSSAGLMGNGKAAMELQGHWNPGVMAGLTPDQKGLGDKLGWFTFPAVSGGSGVDGAMLGGGDGYSCSYKAPRQACVEFLKYISSVDVQKRWAALNVGLPVTKGSEGGVADPSLRNLIDIRGKATFVQLYLDIAFSTSVGQALDDAIANQFAGSATPDQVVKAIADAAKNR